MFSSRLVPSRLSCFPLPEPTLSPTSYTLHPTPACTGPGVHASRFPLLLLHQSQPGLQLSLLRRSLFLPVHHLHLRFHPHSRTPTRRFSALDSSSSVFSLILVCLHLPQQTIVTTLRSYFRQPYCHLIHQTNVWVWCIPFPVKSSIALTRSQSLYKITATPYW